MTVSNLQYLNALMRYKNILVRLGFGILPTWCGYTAVQGAFLFRFDVNRSRITSVIVYFCIYFRRILTFRLIFLKQRLGFRTSMLLEKTPNMHIVVY